MTGCVSPSASDLETMGTVTQDVVVGEVTGRGVAKLGGWVAGKVAGPLTSILGRCADNTVVRILTGQVASRLGGGRTITLFRALSEEEFQQLM